MKKKRIMAFILALLMLPINIVFADSKEVTYKEMMAAVKEESGEEVLSPEIDFNLNFTNIGLNENVSGQINDDDFFDDYSNPGMAAYQVPDNIEVPVGTKITGTDLSKSLYPGGQIQKWDWQTSYWDEKGSPYKDKYVNFDTKNFELIADKPGFIFVHLNIADDKVFYQEGTDNPINFLNWASNGNWKTKGHLKTGEGYLVKDWYFNVVRIKVVEDTNGESNMLLRDMELLDSTGKVIDYFKREVDPIDPMDIEKQKINKSSEIGEGPILKKGEKYTLRSSYQFISFEKGKFNISNPSNMTEEQKALSTKINKNDLDTLYSFDENVGVSGVYSERSSVISNDKGNVELKNLDVANFEWSFTVPESVNQKGVLGARVPVTFTDVNSNEKDDWGAVNFRLAESDLKAINIELIDENNQSVKTFIEGKKYKFRFNVQNDCNSVAVIGKGNTPLTGTIIGQIDGKPLLKNKKILNRVLEPCKIDNIETGWFNPIGDEIKVGAIIDPIHKEEGNNSDPTNDRAENIFRSKKDINNYYVKNVTLNPKEIHLGENQKGVKAPIKIMFNIGHESDSSKRGTPTNPKVEIKHNGKSVWSRNIQLGVGAEKYMEVPLSLDLGKGTHKIDVEINMDKKYQEKHPSMSNPYIDNTGNANLEVTQRNDAVSCTNQNEKNKWTKYVDYTFNGKKWISGDPGYWDFLTVDNLHPKTINLYEDFKIMEIKAGSKLGSGTFNAANAGSGSLGRIKVKAGHGFDIAVKTNYKTNDTEPSGVYGPKVRDPYNINGYEGQTTRNQHPTAYHDMNEVVSIELPFVVNGTKVNQRVILGNKSGIGNWYDRTNSHDLKKIGNNERMIYVPEGTHKGVYRIEVNTTISNGIRNKMQSCRYFEIEVLERDSGTTHISQ